MSDDFKAGELITHVFPTRDKANSAPVTFSDTPALVVIKGATDDESAAGLTLAVDYKGRTGSNQVKINTADDAAFYTRGDAFSVVVSAGTVDGQSVVGETVYEFTIEKQALVQGVNRLIRRNALQAGSSATVVILDPNASSENNFYNEKPIYFPELGYHSDIASYDGATKAATLSEPLPNAPAAGAVYEIETQSVVDVHSWRNKPVTIGPVSQLPDVNAGAISDSTTAADQVEANIPNLDLPVSSRSTLTQQQVANAMNDAPAAGSPAGGSVHDKLDTIGSSITDATPTEKHRDSDVVTTGTQTGTSANTLAQDGVEWVLTAVAAGIDAELVFNIGTATENPSSLRIWGRFDSGKNRVLQLQAYNFTLAGWESLSSPLVDGKDTNAEIIRTLGRAFVKRGQAGTPGTDGDVRIRFLYSSAVSNKVNAGDALHLDEVSVFHTNEVITNGELIGALLEANPQRNYPDSAIVIDTQNGQPGQKFGENGTNGNPSSNLVDAFALAGLGGYEEFIVRSNSSLLLDRAAPNWTWNLSLGAELDLGPGTFDVDNSSYIGGRLKGVALAATVGIRAVLAQLNGLTAWGSFLQCELTQVAALILNGTAAKLIDCSSGFPGTANPSINANSVAALQLSIVKYGGGVDVGGLANDAKVTIANVAGSYSLTDAATTATVITSGNQRRIGALPTGVNITEDARVDLPGIRSKLYVETLDDLEDQLQRRSPGHAVLQVLHGRYNSAGDTIDTLAADNSVLFAEPAGTDPAAEPLVSIGPQ